jgi:hypothetical protein
VSAAGDEAGRWSPGEHAPSVARSASQRGDRGDLSALVGVRVMVTTQPGATKRSSGRARGARRDWPGPARAPSGVAARSRAETGAFAPLAGRRRPRRGSRTSRCRGGPSCRSGSGRLTLSARCSARQAVRSRPARPGAGRRLATSRPGRVATPARQSPTAAWLPTGPLITARSRKRERGRFVCGDPDAGSQSVPPDSRGGTSVGSSDSEAVPSLHGAEAEPGGGITARPRPPADPVSCGAGRTLRVMPHGSGLNPPAALRTVAAMARRVLGVAPASLAIIGAGVER